MLACTQKFAPKVRVRAADRAAKPGAAAGPSNAAAEDKFKELIKAAQSDKAWERGAGRGRGAGQPKQSEWTKPPQPQVKPLSATQELMPPCLVFAHGHASVWKEGLEL